MTKAHHPSNEDLTNYTNGTLRAGLATVISTHLEFCSFCKTKVQRLSDDLSHQFLSIEEQPHSEIDLEAEFHKMSPLIFSPLEEKVNKDNLVTGDITAREIHFDDKSFTLPKSLSSICTRYLDWRRFGENSAVCRVTDEANGNLLFIYVGPGDKIPEHGHEGSEYGCVLNGSFQSEGQFFSTGDFTVFHQETCHAPFTQSEDGCLVVVWLEKRLNFLTGILRPFNPLLWWYLNR